MDTRWAKPRRAQSKERGDDEGEREVRSEMRTSASSSEPATAAKSFAESVLFRFMMCTAAFETARFTVSTTPAPRLTCTTRTPFFSFSFQNGSSRGWLHGGYKVVPRRLYGGHMVVTRLTCLPEYFSNRSLLRDLTSYECCSPESKACHAEFDTCAVGPNPKATERAHLVSTGRRLELARRLQ